MENATTPSPEQLLRATAQLFLTKPELLLRAAGLEGEFKSFRLLLGTHHVGSGPFGQGAYLLEVERARARSPKHLVITYTSVGGVPLAVFREGKDLGAEGLADAARKMVGHECIGVVCDAATRDRMARRELPSSGGRAFATVQAMRLLADGWARLSDRVSAQTRAAYGSMIPAMAGAI